MPRYRKNMPGAAQWLLLVAGAGAGGALDIFDAEGVFTSSFNRLIFLDCHEGGFIELSVARP